ncbi:tetratricopeptide repeat protein [Pannus brasiliensis CCIBt3594]|uniref:Tetratricopeptide repeat protein n=1 Tax=Pannus brasiliensis CCIBt3594 TaxID=1427578 RepID=A0AAW9QG24_9CHRO
MNALIFALDVPPGIIPPVQADAASRVDALLDWAKSPTGCGVERVGEILTEMLAGNKPTRNSPPHNIQQMGTPYFVGREKDLERLHNHLQNTRIVCVYAVTGMGGIGKTELALQYARKRLEDGTYRGGACWLRCGEDIGLQILDFGRSSLNLTLPDDLEFLAKTRYVWDRWRERDGDKLVIFDDVPDYEKINLYLPIDSSIKILLTTRKWLGASVQKIPLDELSEEAALELLRKLLQDREAERIDNQIEDAKALCSDLGYLPLGLELAGRYLARKPALSLSEFRQRMARQRPLATKALSRIEADMTAQRGIAEAFELTWQELDGETRELATVLSLFASAPIPWWLVEGCLEGEDTGEIEERRDEGLIGWSLLKIVSASADLYQLHPLIREFFALKREEYPRAGEWKESFCRVMVKVAKTSPYPVTVFDIERVQMFISHLEEVATALNSWLMDEDLIVPFNRVARFYHDRAAYTEALLLYRQCLTIVEARFGSDHPDFAKIFNNVAEIYRWQGKYRDAELLYIQSIKIMEQQLGDEHPDVAATLNNLGICYEAQGKYDKAEYLYLRSLKIRERWLGDEHPEVADTLANLAALYQVWGRYNEAEPLYLRSLEIQERKLGTGHPYFANNLTNLAVLYQAQRKYNEAESLYVRSLIIREWQLGGEHLDVAHSLGNLADLYQEQGRHDEAESFYIRSLKIREHHQGKEHPDVAQTLNNLATLYYKQRKYNEAESLFDRSLAIEKRVYGEDHPHVAQSLNNLAALYESLERYEEAEPLYRRALDICERFFGSDHPHTKTVRKNHEKLSREKP